MDLILSIKPKHAENIYSEKKWWEFRTVLPKELWQGTRIWLYETAPVQAVTGFFLPRSVLKTEDFDFFWDYVKYGAEGTSRKDLQKYFSGKVPKAIQIGHYCKLSNPIPSTLIGWKRPPQNFAYCESIPNCFLQTLGYPFNWREDK